MASLTIMLTSRFLSFNTVISAGIALFADRQDASLLWGEPRGKRPGKVLDQTADEPLHATEDRPMDDHRLVGAVVGTNIGDIEPFGRLQVNLMGWALPFSTKRVD